MYTIDNDPTEYASMRRAAMAATALIITFRRGVTIFKDGEPFRYMRY